MAKFILLQELPIAKAGCEVITDKDGGIYRRFAGTWQLVAKVNLKELKYYVGKAPRPSKKKELEGEAFVKDFCERMGWNNKPTSDFPSFQNQTGEPEKQSASSATNNS